MSITVLLADDHRVVSDSLGFLLNSEVDIEIVGCAISGHDAVRQVKLHGPDVVIMDINMPGLNGIDATRRVREISPATQVVMLSMYSSSEFIFQSLHAGARGYLLKESAGQEVVKAVRDVQDGRYYLSEKISSTVIEDYVRLQEGEENLGLWDELSPREREVLQLVVEGKTSAAIAETLHLSRKTVETYRSRVMKKLDIHDVPGLVKFAIRQGLISLE